MKRLLSREHFSVDATLIEAWVSIKGWWPINQEPSGDHGDDQTRGGRRSRECDFHGARWSNATHRSVTDGDCRLYRKARCKEGKLNSVGCALIDNRHSLVIDGLARWATEPAEYLAAKAMLMRREEGERAVTVGADRACAAAAFVETGTAPDRAAWRPQYLGAAFVGEGAPSGEPGSPQAHRGSLLLREDPSRSLEDPSRQSGAGRLAVNPGAGGLRSEPPAEAHGGGMSAQVMSRPLRCRGPRRLALSARPHEVQRVGTAHGAERTNTTCRSASDCKVPAKLRSRRPFFAARWRRPASPGH